MFNVQRLETILKLIDDAEDTLQNVLDVQVGICIDKEKKLKESILGLHSVKELIKTEFKEKEEWRQKLLQNLQA